MIPSPSYETCMISIVFSTNSKIGRIFKGRLHPAVGPGSIGNRETVD
jgi:hypothetical protein